VTDRLAHFLDRHGWGDAVVTPLAGDASFRRYFRIARGADTRIVMDAPVGREDVRPFVAIANYLASRGLSAPRIDAVDAAAGLLLLEDLGDDLFVDALARGANECELYAAASDVLALTHDQPMPARVPGVEGDHCLPAFSDARLLHEVELFADWYWPEVCGEALEPNARTDFRLAWNRVWPLAHGPFPCLVQFDFHSPNLMWLPAREGVRRVGILDFQDAMLGSPAYDVVSLTQDPRRDVGAGIEELVLEHYLRLRRDFDAGAFRAAYAVLGAQRATRILGQFVRLHRRDGKPRYLAFQPRVWAYLERNLAHPLLAPVADWFATHVPAALRADRWLPA